MTRMLRFAILPILVYMLSAVALEAKAQLPERYPMLELFTNTPCPICGSQNPGFFNRLEDFEGQYHLVSFYPGKPYSSCIFYQANKSENDARFQFYPQVSGTPTVVINGTQFKSSGSMSTAVLEDITGGETWLSVAVEETTGSNRTVDVTLIDHVGGSLETGKLYAVIVEREIMYNAPNGETVHYNVFREFLTSTDGDDVDLTSGVVDLTYTYSVDLDWQADEVYVVAWLLDPETNEIVNSGTKFDPVTTGTREIAAEQLHLYPNLATSYVEITLPEGITSGDIRIYNSTGRLVDNTSISGEHIMQIDTKNWPVGQYQVVISEEGTVWRGVIQVVR